MSPSAGQSAHDKAARKISIGGAVVAALAASSCCVGPLIVAALGIGGAGAFAAIGAYRPYILIGTVVLLGIGYYLTYRRPKPPTDACGCEKPNRAASRAGKIGVWMATGMVVLFAAIPPLIARIERAHASVRVAPGVTVEIAVIHVQGIDCEACAGGLRKAMRSAGGFHDLKLDIANQTATITYEPAPGRLEAYAKAIEDETGFEVTLPPGPTAGRRQ